MTVICPQGAKQDREPEATIEGVRILRYPLQAATGGPLGYVREYSARRCGTRCAWRSPSAARERIDVVQAVQPARPAVPRRASCSGPFGARFVFDQHDLVPELFQSRFARRRDVLYWAHAVLERITFAAADAVISTNESYRRVAIDRGGVAPERVSVVRSAPDLARFTPRPARSRRCAAGKAFLGAYLGVMGPQDGVDYALRAARPPAPRARPRRRALRVHGRRRRLRRHGRAGRSGSARPTASSSPGGYPTSSCRCACPPRTCACPPTRATRSTTCRR